MISIYLASTSAYSGKSLICMGLGRRFIKDGYKIGYLKPFGTNPVRVDNVLTDADAEFIEQTLNLSEPPQHLCPVMATPDLNTQALEGKTEDLEKKVISAFQSLSRDKDIMLIGGGGDLSSGGYLGISGTHLIEKLNAQVILIDKYNQGVNLDRILAAREKLGDRLIGVILNRVYESKIDKLKRLEIPFLERKGIRTLGMIPHDTTLFAVSVEKLREALGGEYVCGEEHQNELVERFSVGAMSVESALKYFRRTKNKAVITGGDRADIQLAALETSTKAIILTGGLYPNKIIISRAEQMKVPLILVKTDTLTTVERFEHILGRLSIREERKVKRATKLVNENIDFELLYKLTGR